MDRTARDSTIGSATQDFLTVREVAQRLKVSQASVYAVIAEGKLPGYRIGAGRGTIRVSVADLQSYLAECRTGEVKQVQKISRPRLKHLKL
jgi:excisionase family DNA binding protein